MDVYINAVSEDPYIHTIYLVNYKGTFWWRTRYWIQLYKTVEVYFNYQKRSVKLFHRPNLCDLYGEVRFNFQEQDLVLLGDTMQFCLRQSTYSASFIWIPGNSYKTKKVIHT